jgi:hypothetical protein
MVSVYLLYINTDIVGRSGPYVIISILSAPERAAFVNVSVNRPGTVALSELLISYPKPAKYTIYCASSLATKSYTYCDAAAVPAASLLRERPVTSVKVLIDVPG